ncbi:hypothetical protein ABFS83_10G080400 [Erythranthe nasuta]
MAEIEVPHYFICPISLEIMKDPVTVSTGITYDRESIEKWIFSQNNQTCPVTKQLLVSSSDAAAAAADLTPNITVRRLIQSWCTLHAVERLPTPKPPATKPQILKLLRDAAKSPPQAQIKCLQKLRSIAAQNETNKRCMETAGAAEFLAAFVVGKSNLQSGLEEDLKACDEAMAVLHGLRLTESGLKTLSLNGEFVGSLTPLMQRGSDESRAYSIMLLQQIVEVAEPSHLINLRPDFFAETTQILKDQICEKASKSALKVLINVCAWGRNRIKAVEAGLVAVIIDLLLDLPSSSSEKKSSCEMMLTALDLVCQCAEGRAEVVNHAAGLAVVSKKILRVSPLASERGVRILYSISRFSAGGNNGILQEMLQIGVVAKLCLIMQVDCGVRTKERAREMLKLHSRAWRNSPCLPRNLVSSYPS